MVCVPHSASRQVRAEALARRIVACRASATVLQRSRRHADVVAELLTEADELEAELNQLKALPLAA